MVASGVEVDMIIEGITSSTMGEVEEAVTRIEVGEVEAVRGTTARLKAMKSTSDRVEVVAHLLQGKMGM